MLPLQCSSLSVKLPKSRSSLCLTWVVSITSNLTSHFPALSLSISILIITKTNCSKPLSNYIIYMEDKMTVHDLHENISQSLPRHSRCSRFLTKLSFPSFFLPIFHHHALVLSSAYFSTADFWPNHASGHHHTMPYIFSNTSQTTCPPWSFRPCFRVERITKLWTW